MCLRCDDSFDVATEILDGFVRSRTEFEGSRYTAAQNVIGTAGNILDDLPTEMRGDPFVQNLCLSLAAAVERLVALEQCGIST